MKKTLLLNFNYEPLSFIIERRAIKLLVKEKVEALHFWDEYLTFVNGKMQLPAVLRLKEPIIRNCYDADFNRKAIIRRDNSTCQYCSKVLSKYHLTIDHIIPKSKGGPNNYKNCVVCCKVCNLLKGNKTPEEAKMFLIKAPARPSLSAIHNLIDEYLDWHDGWDDFFPKKPVL